MEHLSGRRREAATFTSNCRQHPSSWRGVSNSVSVADHMFVALQAQQPAPRSLPRGARNHQVQHGEAGHVRPQQRQAAGHHAAAHHRQNGRGGTPWAGGLWYVRLVPLSAVPLYFRIPRVAVGLLLLNSILSSVGPLSTHPHCQWLCCSVHTHTHTHPSVSHSCPRPCALIGLSTVPSPDTIQC